MSTKGCPLPDGSPCTLNVIVTVVCFCQGQRDAGDVQDLQGDRGDRPGARRERRRHRGEPEATFGGRDHRSGGAPHVQARRGQFFYEFLLLNTLIDALNVREKMG